MKHPEIDWLKKWANYTPTGIALRDHLRDVVWTYAEVQQRTLALAGYLQQTHGVCCGDRVLLYSHNCSESIFLFFACVKLGVVLVPVNYRLTPAELSTLIEDAEPALVLHEDRFKQQITEIDSITDAIVCLDMAQLGPFLYGPIPGEYCQLNLHPGQIDDLAMILYTSGTTGVPKGVKIDHKMLLWNSINTNLRLDLNSADHSLSFAPFFHTGGWNVLLTPFLHTGASHTVLPGFDPDLVLELIEKEKVTVFFAVPTMLQMLADSPAFANCDLSSLRFIVVGGSPLPVPVINTWQDRGVFIRQGYGLTEVGPNCFSLHQDHAISKRGSIGFPNFYIDTRIVDETGKDSIRSVVDGSVVGELWLKSEVVTPGYWRNEKATAASITDGWFHTGDMVKRDSDGFFYVVDRKKNMYISGGENVYPAEVEACLVTHPAIKEAVVIGIPDQRWGETGRAYLVLQENEILSPETVVEFCSTLLAKYKIPKHFSFVTELPLTDTGKVNRALLSQLGNRPQGE